MQRIVPALVAVPWVVALAATAAAAPRIEPLTQDGLPNVQAARAVVMDADTGAVLYARQPSEVAAIASTGKIFVAMVVRARAIDLDAVTEITEVDRMYAKGGARTRLAVGHGFRNLDLLRAMLIASDNRAPTALGRAVGLSPEQLVAAMNSRAAALGLVQTRFTDPSGLRGNVSTASEMALALRAALADPVLAEILATPEVTVRSHHRRPHRIFYRNTNVALHRDQYLVTGGKTGYTTAAGYCLLISARAAGRDVIMVFLGEQHKMTRFGDFGRVMAWLSAAEGPALLADQGEPEGSADDDGGSMAQVGVAAAR
ncbi:D-alanyl-D-alanine carboxypeptidase family protein [Haliangium sp.]|uniref:D-alanyl-D-alanine carboxypeptidase family protein n=1 Tax=Haliangium sp. TaxID=2663208 RepID=UPI003D11B26C